MTNDLSISQSFCYTSWTPLIHECNLGSRFLELNRKTQLEKPPFSERSIGNLHNRYGNVLPFRNNMFRFMDSSNYFNASQVLKKRVIACQGPKSNEHPTFWRMAWESGSTAVVMVTDLTEGSGYQKQEKCSWYLPSASVVRNDASPRVLIDSDDDSPRELDIEVSQLSGPPSPFDQAIDPEAVIRKIRLQCGQETKEIIHYHFMGWKDLSSTSSAVLAELVKAVYNCHYSKGESLITHCSAGIGRTGTFLTILEAYARMLAGEDLTPALIDSIIENLRSTDEGRINMVSTREQYFLIYETLAILDPKFDQEFQFAIPAK